MFKVSAIACALLLAAVPRMLAIDFSREIQPILSDRCYFCHGPDKKNNKADLRLDTAEGAREVLGNGELLLRITSDDKDEVMPPPKSNLKLTAAERDLIRRWISEGGKYEQHWAFVPPRQDIPLPAVSDPGWPRTTLDHFILARLDAEKLRPAPPADALRWLRRVTFDLTGLPPSAEEIAAFLKDGENEKVVDRLLASAAYGEHMAVSWLDAARYADSYGYQSDKLNTQWPYRDWVVRAFNENLPYDQFLTQQLAGDLLPKVTREQQLATAFNRIHRLNNEGGAIFEEWRIENVADRVHTFGTAMLGLTLECCRCHDHKYDPISQRDYYALSAFFNSIDENGLYDRTEKVPSPTLLLPDETQGAALASARKAVLGAERECEKLTMDQPAQEISDQLIHLDFNAPLDKEVGHPSKDDRNVAPAIDSVTRDAGNKAVALDGDIGITLKNIEPFDRWTPFTVHVRYIENKRVPQRAVVAHHTRGTDAGYNGWDLTIENGCVESRLYRVWPGNAIGVRTTRPIPANRWQDLTATYDGSSHAAGLKLYLDGEPLVTATLRDEMVKSANVVVDHGGSFVLGQRFRDRGFAHAYVDDLRIYSRDLSQDEVRHLCGQKVELRAFPAAARAARERLMQARHTFVMAEEVMNEIPVMHETASPRETHVLARGAYDAPTSDATRVTRATFKSIGPAFPKDAPQDRLGLARWVTLPENPFTARVAVNRLWANFFGTGIFATHENLGLQGTRPTHPELLDRLASDFVKNGWNAKALCKEIALSATYRQDSKASPELLAADPENLLHARGPSYRLSAEQIRDMALAGSGLLNPERGGPPVSPYQPGGDLWRESNSMSPAYEQSVGKALHRRSLYSVWKRTAPLPNMLAFDAPTREVCTVKRSRTNTPLQALALLNDVQFVEAARLLAARALNDADPVGTAFSALAGRPPDATEREVLTSLRAQQTEHYQSQPGDAAKFLALGETPPPPETNPNDLAAMTITCQVILSLDAAIWKR